MNELNIPPKKRGPKRKLFEGEKCSICGEDGTGFNYGALTCNPCKSFFRRTILENKLSEVCENTEVCSVALRRYCSGCRLHQCLAMGMKADYVRELNIKRIRRRIEKIPQPSRLMKFSETLDPFQENFLSVIEGFWIAYRNLPNTTNEVHHLHGMHPQSVRAQILGGPSSSGPSFPPQMRFVQKTTKDAVCLIESKIKKFKLPNTNCKNPLEGITLVKDVINFQILVMNVYLTSIPTIRWQKLTDSTKRSLLASTAMEIPVMRYANRYKSNLPMLFEQDQLTGQGIGISDKMKREIFSLMVEFNQLDLDTYETALVAALCATSPDRGIQENFDYRILAATQETIMEILRIKFEIDNRPMKLLAACIGFISKLRIYSHHTRPEWLKFVHHKPIIVFKGAREQCGEVRRNGLDFIAQAQF